MTNEIAGPRGLGVLRVAAMGSKRRSSAQYSILLNVLLCLVVLPAHDAFLVAPTTLGRVQGLRAARIRCGVAPRMADESVDYVVVGAGISGMVSLCVSASTPALSSTQRFALYSGPQGSSGAQAIGELCGH